MCVCMCVCDVLRGQVPGKPEGSVPGTRSLLLQAVHPMGTRQCIQWASGSASGGHKASKLFRDAREALLG